MITARADTLLRQLQKLETVRPGQELTDRELLWGFTARRDESAFTELLRRHGPMVWGVCWRLLGHEQDAQDAFQATFLVLARKAGSAGWQDSVANWLYGVASHLALKMRTAAIRRQARESVIHPRPVPNPAEEVTLREARTVLDEELARLPQRLRSPLVLCYLEGLTRDEAARRLGCSLATLKRRLEQGRQALRSRLAGRGVSFSVAGITPLLSPPAEAALASPLLTRAALSFAGGQAPVGDLPGRSIALAEGVLRATAGTRLKSVLALVLALGLLGSGAAAVVSQTLTAKATMVTMAVGPPAERAAQRKLAGPVRTDRFGDPLPRGAIVRLGTVRWRHEGEAQCIAFSADGKTLGVASEGDLYFWDTATGKPLRRIQPLHRVFAFAFSPDGKTLAWKGEGNVHICDAITGQERFRLPFTDRGLEDRSLGRDLLFSPDGKLLATRASGRVIVWDLTRGKQIAVLGKERSFASDLAFSPDSKTMVLATQSPAVQIWSVATGKLIRGIDAQKDPPNKGEVGSFAMAVALSADGKAVASAARQAIVISEVATGKELARMNKTREWVLALGFTPDGKSLVSTGEDNKVRVWDVDNRKERFVLDGRQWIGRCGALSPDGKTVALGAVYNTVRLWDVASGKLLFDENEAHDAPVHTVAYSPDGKLIVTGGENRQVRLWNPSTGRQVRQLKVSGKTIGFSPDGKRLATAWLWGKIAHVWDVASGEEVVQLPHKDADELRGIAYTADGKYLLSLGWTRPAGNRSYASPRLHIWDPAGRHLRDVRLPEMRPSSLAVSPDGKHAAVGGSPRGPRLIDLKRGKEVRALAGHERHVEAVAFSPDGRLLASGSHDQTVRLWEVATGKEVLVLKGHERSVSALVFSPDGRTLASGDGELIDVSRRIGPHCIRVWDVDTGYQVLHLQGFDSRVTSLAFSPDGKRLASALNNSTALIWDLADRGRPVQVERRLTAMELEALWSDLGGEDAGKAHRASWTLSSAPGQAIPFLKARLRPETQADQKKVQQWLADLDSDEFKVRAAAARELRRVGTQAEAALMKVLQGKPSLEVRRRVEAILDTLDSPSAELMQALRAVKVLERIGTKEARQLLKSLAAGPPLARLTEEAKASLGRLGR